MKYATTVLSKEIDFIDKLYEVFPEQKKSRFWIEKRAELIQAQIVLIQFTKTGKEITQTNIFDQGA